VAEAEELVALATEKKVSVSKIGDGTVILKQYVRFF
jgi:hypothetical protein